MIGNLISDYTSYNLVENVNTGKIIWKYINQS